MLTLNEMAKKMGRKGGRNPKHYSPEEIELRRERLVYARAKRWPNAKIDPKNLPLKRGEVRTVNP